MNNEKICRMQWHDWHLMPPLAVNPVIVLCTAQLRILACKMTQLRLLRWHLHIWECYPLLLYTLLLFLDTASPFLDSISRPSLSFFLHLCFLFYTQLLSLLTFVVFSSQQRCKTKH